MAEGSRIDQHGQKEIGQQSNIAGNVTGPMISGEVHGDVIVNPQPPLVLVPHLPPPPRDFTGRDEELQDLLSGFDRGTTITGLRGMGGIGKTALAYALAEKLTGRYPDGQILVELRGTDPVPMTPAEAMARVIRAYHPEFKPPESDAELANTYHSVLHEMQALLLRDNASDDRQVRPLLPPQGCGVIVTSRRKFSLPGLVPMDLDVLRTDKAVELLLKLWKPGAPPSAEGLGDEDLLEIVRLCGFLPLALRSAGSLLANSPDLSPAQYVKELRDEQKRLERIGKEGVDLDVESSFGLSYSRLKPEAAAVFRILSIFPANFDAAAEEFVCQDEGHRILRELVRWSLVEYQRQSDEFKGRYHLHDLVRIFAAGRLEEIGGKAARNDAQQRHAEHFKEVLSSATDLYQNGDALSGLRKFDLERMNIDAGWAWAKGNLARNDAAASLCNSYLDWPYLLELRMHTRERISWLETALAAARKLKDKRMEGVHLGNLGNAYSDQGETRKAIEYQEQALDIAREFGDRRGEGNRLGSLGNRYAELGDTRKAIEYQEQALDIAREIGDRRGEGNTLGNLGSSYADLGETRKAIEYQEKALDIAHGIGDRKGEGIQLGKLGIRYADLGETRKAIEYYEQALMIAREIEDKRGEAIACWNLGLEYEKAGDLRRAVDMMQVRVEFERGIVHPDAEKDAKSLENLRARIEKK
jgi:tetratricopeptide (TPR) repeat protein